ncbi:MAG: formyltransferase family protein [Ginsengibacter sp.]
MKVALLASGNLGLNALNLLLNSNDVILVATDKASEGIIEVARAKSIPLFIGNPRHSRLFEFAHFLEIDILFSINYLFIIEEDVLSIAKYSINLHGSLLPKYRGRTPHVWAIINGETETGITAHIMEKDCDTGNVILQEKLLIGNNDSGSDLLTYYTSIYPQMIHSIIKMIENGKLISFPQDHSKATWFGKRTAEDGEINLSWFKERIRNWVRAQRLPYPGAFIWYNQTKIIIDDVAFSDTGFSAKDENGLVLVMDPCPVIKTANGALELRQIRSGAEVIKKGIILGK